MIPAADLFLFFCAIGAIAGFFAIALLAEMIIDHWSN